MDPPPGRLSKVAAREARLTRTANAWSWSIMCNSLLVQIAANAAVTPANAGIGFAALTRGGVGGRMVASVGARGGVTTNQ